MGKSRQGRVNRLELAGMNNFSCFVLEVVFSCLVSPEIIGFGGGLVAESCLTLATLAAVACQAPLSIGFPRQESWSGLPFLGIKPGSPALEVVSCIGGGLLHWGWPPTLQVDSLLTQPPG